jgi:predicted NBD/HSP70 family sugar kinase
LSSRKISAPVHDLDDLLSLAQNGDPGAREIFNQAGRILGIGIANLVNLFNPQRIIISGEGTREGDFLFLPMKESIQQNTMPGLYDPETVMIAPWGDDASSASGSGSCSAMSSNHPSIRKSLFLWSYKNFRWSYFSQQIK